MDRDRAGGSASATGAAGKLIELPAPALRDLDFPSQIGGPIESQSRFSWRASGEK
jgi:hypothetical protein